MKQSIAADDGPSFRELYSIGNVSLHEHVPHDNSSLTHIQNVDFAKFAYVLERRNGRCLMLVYQEPARVGDVEEVVMNLQGFLLESTLPPLRQFQ